MRKKLDHKEETLLWKGITEGKEESFKKVFEHHYARLLTFGLRVRFDQPLVKDCIQEVFFDIWNKRNQLPPIQNYSAYLIQILRRKVIKAVEKKQHFYTEKTADSSSILPYESLLIEQQDSETKKQELHRAFESLSPRQREIIHLRFFKGLSYDEIAAQTNARKRTIYNQVHEALKVLKKSLLLQLLFFLS